MESVVANCPKTSVEIVLYSSRLNDGNAGNVRFDIAIVV